MNSTVLKKMHKSLNLILYFVRGAHAFQREREREYPSGMFYQPGKVKMEDQYHGT